MQNRIATDGPTKLQVQTCGECPRAGADQIGLGMDSVVEIPNHSSEE
jgi:hypothetical protein